MVQPLITPMVKTMKITSNLAYRRRDGEEPCEEEWDLETFSNHSQYVMFDDYGSGKVTSFGQVGHVEQVLSDSKIHVFTPRSDPENISSVHTNLGGVVVLFSELILG